MAKKGGKGGGNTFLAVLLGAATVAAGGYAWTDYGGSARNLTKNLPSLPGNMPSLPSGVSSDGGKSGDPAMSNTPTPPPPTTRAHKTPPFGISEDVFEAGARTYHARCAGCHGIPGKDGKLGMNMTPPAPQLWKEQAVTDGKDPGGTYEQIAHGVHGSGMPSFSKTMTDTQIWEVTLLLENSGQEMPDPVTRILQGK